MGRFNPDPTAVQATLEVFQKGRYEFQFGEPKAFEKITKTGPNQGKTNMGVRYPITCVEVIEGDANATKKRTFYTGYIHNEEALAFTKGVLLAVLGYSGKSQAEKSAGEERFNAQYKGMDWAVDTETGACGDVWRELTGRRAIADVDIEINTEDGSTRQKWLSWAPVAVAVGA